MNHRDYCAEQYDLHSGRLLRFIRRYGGGHVAEDILQEVFLRFVRETMMQDLRGRELPWLYRTARNLTIDTHRRSSRLSALAAEPQALEPGPPSGELPEELLQRMFGVAARLGEHFELLLHLIMETTVSQAEMGAVLGVSERTVRRMTEQLKSSLRLAIKDWKDFL